jgi:hypothetical protein
MAEAIDEEGFMQKVTQAKSVSASTKRRPRGRARRARDDRTGSRSRLSPSDDVAEACRRGGIDRTSFYDWKRRFQLEGLDGLKDLPPIAPDDHAARGGGADRGAGAQASGLWLQPARGALGAGRPAPVGDHHPEDPQRQGPGHAAERWLALEHKNAEQAIALSPEQAAFRRSLRSSIPASRSATSKASGQVSCSRPTPSWSARSRASAGSICTPVVDTFGSYAFGFLHVSKQPEAAVAVLHNDVLPFYAGLDLPIGAVLTDNGREFCGTERHSAHRKTRVGSPRTNGFV